jgi:hypothetical protein
MRKLLAGRKAEKGRSETLGFLPSAATHYSRTNITVGTWRANRGNARGVIPKRKPSMTDLPLRALVAFAARCALRVEACLYHYDFASPDPKWRQAIRQATRLAIRFARGDRPEPVELETAERAALRAAEQADSPPWQLAAQAAAHAVAAAREACAAPTTVETSFAMALAEECSLAVRARVEAAWQAAGAVGNVREALHRDWATLCRIPLEGPLAFGPPFDPCGDGPLGPLEPEG